MENQFVIGILNIVEDKLREFNIRIPDDDRGDSMDPIVGYHYAELHDRIQEFLEESGLTFNQNTQKLMTTVHTLSVVNSEGYFDGNESRIYTYASFEELIDKSYALYKQTYEEAKECTILEDGEELLSKEEYKSSLSKEGNLCLQCLDSHVNFEYFECEVTFEVSSEQNKYLSIDEQIRAAEGRVSEKSDTGKSKSLESEFSK